MIVMSFMACFSSLYTSMHMSLHCVCSSASMLVLEIKGVGDGGINTDIYLTTIIILWMKLKISNCLFLWVHELS
jgi:hypothetical protein